MAITASGIFGLTLEKMLIAASLPASGLESETATKAMLVVDALTPNYDTMDFRNDVEANEVSGAGYTAGGVVLTATELTLAAGVLTYDTADPSWTSSTITDAMAAVICFARGGLSSADELWLLSDFVTAASTTNGTFLVQVAAGGWATVDYTP